jgi:hypothetical protein
MTASVSRRYILHAIISSFWIISNGPSDRDALVSYHSVTERSFSFDDPGSLDFLLRLGIPQLILLQFGWYRPFPSHDSPSVTSLPRRIGNDYAVDDLG